MLGKNKISFVLALSLAVPLFARTKPTTERRAEPATNPAFERVLARVIAQEGENLRVLRKVKPIVETYVQELAPDNELGTKPIADDYMLGRVDYSGATEHFTMLGDEVAPPSGRFQRLTKMLRKSPERKFEPEGFAHMAEIDGRGLDREHYTYEYVGREFLGELRCLVIDVSPRENAGEGRFLGRVWVEDKNYNIVRFNGTYSPHLQKGGLYLHFDTWRLNVQPGMWLPAYIYSEESDIRTTWAKHAKFKSQTRFWAYDVNREQAQNTFTQVLVDSDDAVNDRSDAGQDLSPVASQRAWERQAEDNALNRMERAGILSRPGEVDKVLSTVINNLIITNNLNIEPEVRARVMLTTPVETYSVGHTIVISRGLLDVLPDEASLAAVLANELAHIILGHRIDTKYAFDDRLIFADDAALQRLDFERNSAEQQAADAKALQLLENSPYKDKLSTVGLFLRQLQDRQTALPHLVRARLGNPLLVQGNQLRLSTLMDHSALLERTKVDQVAALPLGGRIKVDPWSDRIDMVTPKPTNILAASEKMPLELTPVFPYLTRVKETTTSDEPTVTPAVENSKPPQSETKVAAVN